MCCRLDSLESRNQMEIESKSSFAGEWPQRRRSRRGRTEQRRASERDEDLTVSQLPNRSSGACRHRKRAAVCAQDEARTPPVLVGASPQRAGPLLPQPCSVMNQDLLWGEHEYSSNAEVDPEVANSWNLSDNHFRFVLLASRAQYPPRSTAYATQIYFSTIFGKSSSWALVNLTRWGETW